MGREYASRENYDTGPSGERERTRQSDDSWEWWSGEGDAVRRESAGPGTNPSWEEAEAYYQREIEDTDEYKTLQRMEKRYGRLFDQWVEEGVPTDAMGDRESIQAYRRHKGTPIPWYIDDFNDNSLWRNTTDIFEDDREGRDGQTDVPDSVREVLSSPGRSLNPAVQRAVEERMGDSFGDVRIHTGPKAAAAADELDARAFTVGNHVAFGAGEYDPESVEGQHVLVHELAHVRQQTRGAVSMLPTDAPLSTDREEADPERVAGGITRRVFRATQNGDDDSRSVTIHLQRLNAQNPTSEPLDAWASSFEIVQYVDEDRELLHEAESGSTRIRPSVGDDVTRRLRVDVAELPERDEIGGEYDRNLAVAKVSVGDTEFWMAAASGKRQAGEGDESNPLLPGPFKDERVFDHRADDNDLQSRGMWDSEVKIAEHVIREFDLGSESGEIHIFSERRPCRSCRIVLSALESEFDRGSGESTVSISYGSEYER
ncbi:DUF4157 domain-containing protein [Halobaculum sp. MBLA0147]|uniref:eCIS core domain-containing protein n=1 Tax=Halobaculum sp. MBLA0147 TaxID=3079934 RepID=UPI003525B7A5